MKSVDGHIESIGARGEDCESQGGARHAPASRQNGQVYVIQVFHKGSFVRQPLKRLQAVERWAMVK